MAIRFSCQCGKTYSMKDEHAGKTVRCIACHRAIRIPSGSLPESPPPQVRRTKAEFEELACAAVAAGGPPAASAESTRFYCQHCGCRFAASRRAPGDTTTCPTCGHSLIAPAQGAGERDEALPDPAVGSPLAKIQTDAIEPSVIGDSASAVGPRHRMVYLLAGSGAVLVFLGFVWGLGWRRLGPLPLPEVENTASRRNPKVPVEVSYPIIREYFSPRFKVPGQTRHVDIQLNMRVPEEVLREIALEVKSKELDQYTYTRLFFFLSGKGPDRGPADDDAWATANFDAGLRVYILGFTIEELRSLSSESILLRAGSEPLGTWLMENGPSKTRITICQREETWFIWDPPGYEAPLSRNPEESPATGGFSFTQTAGGDRYVVGTRGDLEIQNPEGKLVARCVPIKPPYRFR